MIAAPQYGQPGVLDPNGPFAPASHDQVVPRSYTVLTEAVIDSGSVGPVDGTVAQTLGSFVPSATGTVTVPSVTGTVAVTLGSFVAAAQQSRPYTTSGRQLLKNGQPFKLHTVALWGLCTQCSDSEITQALEGVAAAGFNGATFWVGGSWNASGWNQYTNKAGSNLWSGTVWASTLGSGWSSVDWAVSECDRLGLVASMSFNASNTGTDWEAATNTNMTNAGSAIATRYQAYNHIFWHVMFDDGPGATTTTGSTRGLRTEALFGGINSVEGSTSRPRWIEPARTDSSFGTGWTATTNFHPIQVVYSYEGTSVDDFDGAYAEVNASPIPTGDCEPPYDGSGNYPAGDEKQQLRERTCAVIIRGGVLNQFGHEDMWRFGAQGVKPGESLTWQQTLTDSHVLQQGYLNTVLDRYTNDSTWAPTSSFVTTGLGTGDAKAAAGAANHSALAYFPDNRTIVVDTTIISGTGNVRLRWFDPVANSYSTIAASEAQNASRSVTLPAARGDGTRDFLLVVDDFVEGTVAVTLGSFTSSASGQVGQVGSSARTLGSFTSSASGTSTPPAFTGTAAVTLGSFTSTATGAIGANGIVAVALGNFTSSASGTSTPPAITGTVAVTLGSFTSSASGTFAPSGSGFGSPTLSPFTSSASGTFTPPAVTGTVAVTLGSFTSSATGASFGPGFNGSAAVTLGSFTSTAAGTVTSPSVTGTASPTLGAFTAIGSGTFTPQAITGTAAIVLGLFVSSTGVTIGRSSAVVSGGSSSAVVSGPSSTAIIEEY